MSATRRADGATGGPQQPPRPGIRLTRRTALIGGATATAGAAGAVGVELLRRSAQEPSPAASADPRDAAAPVPGTPLATARIGFHGRRQAGVDTPPQAHAAFLGIRLHRQVDREGVRRLLRVLTADAAQLTQGQAPVTDQERELAEIPANLTVTVGFGERIFDLVAPHAKPSWLRPLPAFPQIDRLQEEWGAADLLLQIGCEDRVTLAHAQRVLLKDVRGFGTLAWTQQGFRNAAGSVRASQTTRNLFGQVDGTVNPSTEDGSVEDVVWGRAEGLTPWTPDGTSVVIRRIHMNLDTWDEVDTPGREDAVGRTLADGAPLTGGTEHTPADLSATGPHGFPVIARDAHLRRATATTPLERILRRPYNYDLPVAEGSGFSGAGHTDGGVSRTGLIFAAYQADPVRQFVPIQRRLAELDRLNTWTVPIGSAVFAIPPGCEDNGFVGETLFS
ncbi:Dyp-type peroxidase [Rothia kristinae]|uniref:Dyp-type peroxidase n=1 Tax=Rothia kristinae TaxID=37923 RepID=UPI0018C9D57C|nr:Dyp-type peroxidase [Rothia kristinae]